MEDGEIREVVAREIALFECARPQITTDIGAVLVFSGPGTVIEPISIRDAEWMSWFDLRRVTLGISIVLKVTGLRLAKHLLDLTRNDVEQVGPYFIYNGVNSKHENEDLGAYFSLPRFRIPESKLVLVDEVRDDDGSVREIKHTGDQLKSFPSHLLGNRIKGAIALVSNAPHFPRILRYMDYYRPIPEEFPIRCFPIHSDPEWATIYANSEIEALCRYLKAGFLSPNPYPADLGLGSAS